MNKILRNLGLASLVTLANGCAGILPQKSASEKLDIPYSMVAYNGDYAMHRSTEMQLRVLAGILAGTVNVKREGNETIAEGYYSQAEDPEAIEYVLQKADANSDELISREEGNVYYRKLMGAQ